MSPPAALLVALSSVLPGCVDEVETPSEQFLTVVHWWTGEGEKEAYQALKDVHRERYEGVSVTDNAFERDEDAKAEVHESMVSETQPRPDVYQANMGLDLFTWADENDSESQLRKLSAREIVNRELWSDVFPKEVLDQLGPGNENEDVEDSEDVAVYGVPIGIHRLNTLFYSCHVFEELGLAPPTADWNLEELHSAIKQINEYNSDLPPDEVIVPLAVSPRWMHLLFFENLLIAMKGAGFYLEYFGGQATTHEQLWPTMAEVLDEAEHLWDMATRHDDNPNRDWGTAVTQLANNEAAMVVMGDWAKGTLEGMNKKLDVDYGQVPFPGTDGVFVFTADTFAAPFGSPHPQAALDWLRTVASVEGQAAFNEIKGSIPAVRSSATAPDSQATVRDFEESTLVPALSALVPLRWDKEVKDRFEALALEGDRLELDDLRFVLENYYDLLQ